MAFSFTLTVDERVQAPQELPDELAGEDISLIGGDFSETSSGDLLTVVREDAAWQSIVRESGPPPGIMPRRPEWGCGIDGLLFKGNTPDVRAQMATKLQTRIAANPRVSKINSIVPGLNDDGDAQVLINCDVVGAPSLSDTIVFTTPSE
jgi:phage baseplate assembly protein W